MSTTYRDFILQKIEERFQKKGKRLNFAEFSRKAGFSSRSFVNEVLKGNKRITARSLPFFVKGLGLNKTEEKLFRLLVIKEENDLNFDNISPHEIEKQLHTLNEKLNRTSSKSEPSETQSQSLYRSLDTMAVYSALGELTKGATLNEISQRTGLSLSKCQPLLKDLVAAQIVREEGLRFYANESHLAKPQMGKRVDFKSLYLEGTKQAQKRAIENFNSRDELFLQSVFSIDKKQLPELKNRLRTLLTEFALENQNDSGDGVVKLNATLFL